MSKHSRRQVLAATMIVKNEEAVLARCLSSLQGVVDEIHVHDTGSTDATPRIAADFGAHVTHGPWTNDFAAARNAALEGWTADWALVIDADETVVADVARLREYLAATRAGIVDVDVDHPKADVGVTATHLGGRLFRPRWAMWVGELHEQLGGRTRPLQRAAFSRHILRVVHNDDDGTAVRAAKRERNLAIAQAQVDALAAQGAAAQPEVVADTLMGLCRSQIGVERIQDAVDTCELIRELFPGTHAWTAATSLLARLLLESGMADAALFLAEQMRAAGAPATFCDYVSAHAFRELGAEETARRLFDGITGLVDPVGQALESTARLEAQDRAARTDALAAIA